MIRAGAEVLVHPTQKPVALMRWCLSHKWVPEAPVLDPYMGSGPVLCAAKDLNREAIGIEIEERYCEIAAQRLAQTVMNFGPGRTAPQPDVLDRESVPTKGGGGMTDSRTPSDLKKRRIALADRPAKDQQGNRICRWCRGPVELPRLMFCSKECVHEYRLRSDTGYVKWCVWGRDHGICAVCGLDAKALRDRFRALGRWLMRRRHVGYTRLRLAFLKRHSIPIGRQDSDWWDADHVLPVEDGGGECGLDGYQTLCIPCHQHKTAEQAYKKAERRRGQVPLELEA